jgi:hypothetical protein
MRQVVVLEKVGSSPIEHLVAISQQVGAYAELARKSDGQDAMEWRFESF